jgi:hypothetical protein
LPDKTGGGSSPQASNSSVERLVPPAWANKGTTDQTVNNSKGRALATTMENCLNMTKT